MSTRLSTIAPDLEERLAQRPSDELRRIAERVAEAAIERAELDDVRSKDALTTLRAGTFGETEEREAAKRLTEELDEIAWTLRWSRCTKHAPRLATTPFAISSPR